MSPIYEYRCACGKHYEAYHSVDLRDYEVCSNCGTKPERVLSFDAKPIVYEYFSENLNAQITGPKQKAQLLKEKNMSEV